MLLTTFFQTLLLGLICKNEYLQKKAYEFHFEKLITE